MSDESCWKKDTTSYLIFKCSKCRQYLYVKQSQKTKKCLRCGKSHNIKNVNEEEIINGMTNAVNRVKERQNELAKKELGNEPELRGINDFHIKSNTKSFGFIKKHKKNAETKERFQALLIELSSKYKIFPKYMVELLIGDYQIEKSELKLLIVSALKKDLIKEVKKDYFQVLK